MICSSRIGFNVTALTSFVVRSPYLASVLDQRDDRILVGIAASAMHLRTLLPDERLVSLNLFSGPAGRVHLQNAHLLAEPMRHEPGVLSVMPNVRCSWLLITPFVLEHIRNAA